MPSKGANHVSSKGNKSGLWWMVVVGWVEYTACCYQVICHMQGLSGSTPGGWVVGEPDLWDGADPKGGLPRNVVKDLEGGWR